MKKDGIIHPELLATLAARGHNDQILGCDAGYPIPMEVPRIDLGYRRGQPRFLEVLEAITAEIVLETGIIAAETSEELARHLAGVLGLEPQRIPHVDLKARAHGCKAAVRTGEFTPYANVILVAGVAFG